MKGTSHLSAFNRSALHRSSIVGEKGVPVGRPFMKKAAALRGNSSNLLLRPALLGSSAPYAEIHPRGYDQQNHFEEIYAVSRKEDVGQGCPGHEEKSYERQQNSAKCPGDAVGKQPHEKKRRAGREC
jgi:hypothetical protein